MIQSVHHVIILIKKKTFYNHRKRGFKMNIKDFQTKAEKIVKYLFVSSFIGAACYLPLIANGYTNSIDGLWYPTFFQAGNWELSLGRWAWLFMDKIREGYAADPFNSLLTLLLISIGTYLILSIFGIRKHHLIYLLLILISPTVCCYLSYRYMSPTFGASFLLSAIALFFVSMVIFKYNRKPLSILTAIIAVTISLGLYQANIGCFCIGIVIVSMRHLLNKNKKQAIQTLGFGALTGIIGCIAYKILWDIALFLRHTAPSNYQGASSISILNILKMLPNSILHSYYSFIYYFSFTEGKYVFAAIRVALFILLALVVLVNGIRILHSDISSLVLYIILFLLIPVATNIFHLMAPFNKGLQMQMTSPLSLLIPLFLCLLESSMELQNNKQKYLVPLIMGAIFLYGNIYAVGADMDAMAQGSTASQTIMTNVSSTLLQNDLLNPEYKYAFVGSISDSPLFKTNELYNNASYYARFGEFGTNPGNVASSYAGLLDDMAINLNIVWGDEYEKILTDKSTENMPVYPQKGSIKQNGNVVVIKISNKY